MAEGFKSRAYRLTFLFSSQTDSLSSYICLPTDFWNTSSSPFEQLGLSFIPVDKSLCWSTSPFEDAHHHHPSPLLIDTIGMDDTSEYVPFVVGTSIIASGVIKLALSDLGPVVSSSTKNATRLLQPKDQEPGELKIIYDFRPEGNTVLIPAIPAILTPADFLLFLRDATGIVDIRLVREASPGRYMALLRFQSRRHAVHFAETYSDRPFSPLETTVCRVLNVAEIEFSTRVKSIVPLFDPSEFKDQQVKSIAFDEEMIFEVPTCPVCLDRLDSSITGIITTICSHTFHCECMQKWFDGSCPVCRFLLSEDDGIKKNIPMIAKPSPGKNRGLQTVKNFHNFIVKE